VGPSESNWGFTIVKVFGFFSLSLSLNRVSYSFAVLTKLLKACKSLQSLGVSLEMGGKGRNKKLETVRNRFHHSRQSPTRTNLMDLFFICFAFLFFFPGFGTSWVGPWVPGAATVAEGSARENGSSIDGSNRGWRGHEAWESVGSIIGP
jgi:hypothetical protein